MTAQLSAQLIVIQNRLPDYIIVVSLKEPQQKHFVVTLCRESQADHEEVIEEWFLKKGQHCMLEFEDDEVVTLEDRLKLSLDYDSAEEHGTTCTTVSIAGFQN